MPHNAKTSLIPPPRPKSKQFDTIYVNESLWKHKMAVKILQSRFTYICITSNDIIRQQVRVIIYIFTRKGRLGRLL